MTMVIEKDFFFNALEKINRLHTFKEWFFYEGMLFKNLETWWGRERSRPSPHEGLDIGFYKDTNDKIQCLEPGFKVPAVADGVVYDISDDDFLGKSIFVRHDINNETGGILHSVYAHSIPNGIDVNDNVTKGDIIATVSDIRNRNLTISSHLHISMIWLPENYPKNLLKWQLMPESNDVVLSNPLDFLNCSYSTQKYSYND